MSILSSIAVGTLLVMAVLAIIIIPTIMFIDAMDDWKKRQAYKKEIANVFEGQSWEARKERFQQMGI